MNKSKPVYVPLKADSSGRFHLMLGHGEGEVALRRVLEELRSAAPQRLAQTQVLFTPAPSRVGEASFHDLDPAAVLYFDDTAALLRQLGSVLDDARMGTRLYIAGPESFIGCALQIALTFNLNQDEIRTEELGSLARRVHCVHCRATNSEVRTNIVRCSGCARWLIVRDHYSRRLAAYMGLMADAETPGELPPLRDIYT